MKVTNEKTENRQVFLIVEMDSSEMENSLEESYHQLVRRTKIPGFRKGKAPRAVLERHIGKEGLLEEALNNLVPWACDQAIKEQEIEAFAQPRVEVTQTEPLIFKAIVPLKPEVKLGDYQHIEVAMEAVSVTEDDVNDVLEQLRHQQAAWEPVERPVGFGDLVVMDVESNIEGEPFISQRGAQFQVLQEQSFPSPGFAEQLTGMKNNEEKEFKLKYPADYSRADLAEKEPQFKVVVTEIKQEILPELNDEFAAELGADIKTLDLLREQISSDLKLRAEEKARVNYEERVIDAVVDITEVEYPPILEELEINRMLNQRFQGGNQELEEYLKSANQTGEELHEELHPLAGQRVVRSLVLGKIVEEEKVGVDDSEIDAEIETMVKNAAENAGELGKALNTPQARESIEQRLISRKAIEKLVEIAKSPKKSKLIQKEEK